MNLIKTQKPNLVLLDILMPKKGGFKVMEAMVENGGIEKNPGDCDF